MFETVTITPEQEAESERVWISIDCDEAERRARAVFEAMKGAPVERAPVIVEARTRASCIGWGGVVVWNGELLDPGINVPHEFKACNCLSRVLRMGCPCPCHGASYAYLKKGTYERA